MDLIVLVLFLGIDRASYAAKGVLVFLMLFRVVWAFWLGKGS